MAFRASPLHPFLHRLVFVVGWWFGLVIGREENEGKETSFGIVLHLLTAAPCGDDTGKVCNSIDQ